MPGISSTACAAFCAVRSWTVPEGWCATAAGAPRSGADTLRLYEMAMGPLDASRPWSTRDIVGVHRFLQRLWRNVVDEDTGEVVVVEENFGIKITQLLGGEA